jgi:hypothetical protein
MTRLTLVSLLCTILLSTACREGSRAEQDESEAIINSETGKLLTLPSDAVGVTKALINGILYKDPSFRANTITLFDTSQQLFLLDTTDIIFVKVRLMKDTTAYTGYVSKAILPEK